MPSHPCHVLFILSPSRLGQCIHVDTDVNSNPAKAGSFFFFFPLFSEWLVWDVPRPPTSSTVNTEHAHKPTTNTTHPPTHPHRYECTHTHTHRKLELARVACVAGRAGCGLPRLKAGERAPMQVCAYFYRE
ncbi:hypothetical protein GGS23DRAFT_589698 [Durotheca rogersii]|uniref:uncharacterized protein n=1 Tax=Durotheca rogersii TaxID=419775 RepID=UPI0022209D5D|nr:uncharacterized protein GGS23DRAFT_589698 [Durotheca rogersii]KAI5855562.1 hypothetical protein GGS23DRAFT_589698 [Durotheca rogersii]